MERKSNSQLILAITSLFVGTLTSAIFSFCLNLYVLRTTGSSFYFAVILLIQPVINLLLSPLVGYLVDKYNHKLISLCSQAASVLIMVLFISGFFRLRDLCWQIIVIGGTTVLLTICDNFQSTSYKASTRRMVIDRHLQKLVSGEQFASTGVTILSPILGGLLFGTIKLGWIAAIELAGELIVLLAIILLNFYLVKPQAADSEVLASAETQSLAQSFKSGLKYILTDHTLQALAIFAAFANFSLSGLEIGLPIIMLSKMRISSQVYGITESLCAVGMLVTSLGLAFTRSKQEYLKQTGRLGLMMALGFLIIALTSLLSSQTIIITVFSLCMFIIGACLAGINLPYSMYVRTQVAENKQGRIGATISAIVAVLMPLGYATFGVLFNLLQPIWSLLLCFAGLVVDSLYLLLSKHSGRTLNSK